MSWGALLMGEFNFGLCQFSITGYEAEIELEDIL
jgi:hypothetical protein